MYIVNMCILWLCYLCMLPDRDPHDISHKESSYDVILFLQTLCYHLAAIQMYAVTILHSTVTPCCFIIIHHLHVATVSMNPLNCVLWVHYKSYALMTINKMQYCVAGNFRGSNLSLICIYQRRFSPLLFKRSMDRRR